MNKIKFTSKKFVLKFSALLITLGVIEAKATNDGRIPFYRGKQFANQKIFMKNFNFRAGFCLQVNRFHREFQAEKTLMMAKPHIKFHCRKIQNIFAAVP